MKSLLATGCFDYFPDALLAVADVSAAGQKQHGIEGPLRWDRSIASDEDNALARHFLKRGTLDTDGRRHSAKVAWRALALLQKEIEASRLPQSKEAEVGVLGSSAPVCSHERP